MRRVRRRLLLGLLALALVLPLLAAPAQAAEWTQGGTLPSTYQPLGLIVDGRGGADLLLATTTGALTSHRPAGGTWSTPQLLVTGNVTSARMAGNAAGAAVAVWDVTLGPNSYQTWIARRPAGGEWGAAALLAADTVAPDVAIDDADTVYVVAMKWPAPRSTVAYVLPPGATSGAPTTLGPASAEIGASRIAAANGRAAIAWVEASTGTLTAHLASYEGGWTPVVAPVPGLQNFDVAIDRNGNAVVAGAAFIAGGGIATYAFSRSPGGTWTTDELVRASSSPEVAIDAAGTATAVYRPFIPNTQSSAVARRRPLGGAWGPPQTLAGSGRVAAGGAATVYAQTAGTPTQRLEAFVAGASDDLPAVPDLVSTTPVKAELPLVAVASTGHAGTVWKREDGTIDTAVLGAASARVSGRVVRGISGTLVAGNPDPIGAAGRTLTFKGFAGAAAGQVLTATSGADGTFEASVPTGSYLVELAEGDCAAGIEGCLTVAPLEVAGEATFNAIHVSVRLTGKVRKRTCTANACKLAPQEGATVAATAPGLQTETTTTAKDGTWKLFIDPDVDYAVAASSGTEELRPTSRPVRSTRNVHVGGLDFTSCVADPKAPKNACKRPDLTIEGIEVTQGIQEVELPAVAKAPVAYTGVPLVARRTTVVRVYASNANPFAAQPTGVVAEVTVSQGGRKIASARTTAKALQPIPVLPAARQNRTNGVFEVLVPASAMAAGTLVVRAELDPDGDVEQCDDCEANDEAAVSVPLRTTKAPRVVIVDLTAANVKGRGALPVSGITLGGPDAVRRKLFAYGERWLPLANGTFAVETGVVAPLDISGVIRRAGAPNGNWDACAALDPCAGRLIDSLVSELTAFSLRQPKLAGAHLIAPVRSALEGTDAAGKHRAVAGATSPTYPVTWTHEDAPGTAFHEFLHQFGFLHADSACGGDSGGQLLDPAWPIGRGFIDGFGLDLGPDLTTIAKLIGPPTAYYDPLSYCRDRATFKDTWISTRNWTRLVAKLGGGGTKEAPARLAAATKGALYVSGIVEVDGSVRIATTAPVDATLTPADPAGGYVVVVRDAAGVERSRTPVAATGGDDGALRRIDAVVPAGGGAASIEILPAAGGAALASAAAASTPLAVTLAAPKRNARIAAGKPLAVRWTVTGAAADAVVTGLVELSVDGGRTWRGLSQSAGGSAAVPARLLARASAARLRVRVDDGFRTAIAEVRGLRLAGRAPAVRLVLPFRKGATIAKGSRGAIGAVASDDAGRAIGGQRLLWRRGTVILARGARLPLAGLQAGRYTVVVSATDRYGRVGTATVAFRVR